MERGWQTCSPACLCNCSGRCSSFLYSMQIWALADEEGRQRVGKKRRKRGSASGHLRMKKAGKGGEKRRKRGLASGHLQMKKTGYAGEKRHKKSVSSPSPAFQGRKCEVDVVVALSPGDLVQLLVGGKETGEGKKLGGLGRCLQTSPSSKQATANVGLHSMPRLQPAGRRKHPRKGEACGVGRRTVAARAGTAREREEREQLYIRDHLARDGRDLTHPDVIGTAGKMAKATQGAHKRAS
eukprot:351250-Chlamydomonas_euryale.AAC.1